MKTTSYIYLTLCVILGVLAGGLYSNDWLPNYESQTAAAKMNYLWGRIKADTTPAGTASAWMALGTATPAWLGGLDFSKIGGVVSDEMPQGVFKGIHTVGVMCKGKFDWNDNVTQLGLTGSFSKGNAEHVLVRFSSAIDPTKMLVPNSAFKILRNGQPSGNLFTSHQIEAQTTTNWFEWGGCNHVHTLYPGLSKQGAMNAALGAVFGKAGNGNHAGLLGNAEVGTHNQSGAPSARNKTPFAFCVQPTQAMHNSRKGTPLQGANFGGLANIGAGETLYHAYAIMEPQTSQGLTQANVVHIGEFRTTDTCSTSKFGDEKLFYKHTYWTTELQVSGRAGDWAHVNPKWADDEGIEKYERMFKQEHKINTKRVRRRLQKTTPTH